LGDRYILFQPMLRHIVLSCPSFCNVGVLLWPNGWMDQDATWYRGGPWPGDIVLDGDPAPHGNGHCSPPHFCNLQRYSIRINCDPCLLWPNAWMDQDTTLYGGRPRPRQHFITEDPVPPLPRKGAQQPPLPLFWPTLLWHSRPSQQLLSSYYIILSVMCWCSAIVLPCYRNCHIAVGSWSTNQGEKCTGMESNVRSY